MSGRRNILRTEYSGSRGRRSPLAETCQAQHILATCWHTNVLSKDALNVHACASPDHHFVCLAFARSPKKIQEHGGQSEKLGVSGHVNIQSRIFSVPCLVHQVRIGLPRCQVKFSFTIVGSYHHHHPIYMTSPGVFDEQGLCWNPCFLFAGATLRLGGVSILENLPHSELEAMAQSN